MSYLEIALISCGVFGGVFLAMAVGVIFSNHQIKGSCGGLAGMLDENGNSLCESCSTPPEECSDFMKQQCD